MITTPSTWQAWLHQHTHNEDFDNYAPNIAETLRKATNSQKICDLLTDNNPLLLLTKPTIGNCLQFSFLHSLQGSAILQQDKSLLAVAGLDNGAPIEIDPKDLHRSTQVTCPLFETMLRVTDGKHVSTMPISDDNKVKIKNCAILIPTLRETFLKSPEASPTTNFVKFIQRIHEIRLSAMDIGRAKYMESRNTQALTEDQTTEIAQTADATLHDSFANNLYFLWRLCTTPTSITATNCIPALQPPKIDWFHQVSKYIQPPQTSGNDGSSPNPGNNTQFTSAMNKVSEAWERQLEREAKKDREKKDKANWSAWENLADIQRRTILLASMSHDLTPPEKPTPTMMEVLRCSHGSWVELELHQKLNNNIICLDPSLCSCLCKGLLISQPTENDINYYSPAFTSSIPNDKKNKAMSALHYMVQASDGKVSDSMIADMTKQTVMFPKSYNKLYNQIKNFTDLSALLFGENSILALSLQVQYPNLCSG